ncbi:MAG: major facilitator superfamily 1 [Frankiales bacterium]|nr:major facilitator superfamily 1 [Frankiales bacterium]
MSPPRHALTPSIASLRWGGSPVISAKHAAGSRARAHVGWSAVVATLTTCFAVSSVYLTQVAFPQISATMQVSNVEARYAFTVANICYALAFFIFGPISDRFQPRVMAGGGCLALVGLLVAGSAIRDFTAFLIVVGLAGVAAAAVPAAMFTLLPRMAPPGWLGTFFGMIIAATVAGVTLGRSLPGLVDGWQSAFTLLAALLVGSVLLLLTLPGTGERVASRDGLAKVYAQSLRICLTARVARLLGIGLFLFFGYLGTTTFLTLRLTQAPFGYTSTQIGLVSLIGLVGVLGAPVAGATIRRVGPSRVATGSLLLVLLGLVTLTAAGETVLVLIGLLLMFLGVFSCQPAVLALLAGVVPADRRGMAASSYLLVCLLAGGAASAALGPVWRFGGWTSVAAVGASCVLIAALLVRLASRRDTAIAVSPPLPTEAPPGTRKRG